MPNVIKIDLVKAGEPTRNRHIYSREVLERVVADKPSRIVPLSDASGPVQLDHLLGIVDRLEMRGDYLVATVRLLDNAEGKAAQMAYQVILRTKLRRGRRAGQNNDRPVLAHIS
jgi:hypothetical protein